MIFTGISVNYRAPESMMQQAYADCILDEDWPDRPCLDEPPYSEEYLIQTWQQYYEYKGKEWMEVKKVEMDQATANGTLREWVETRSSPNNFANHNIWSYYYVNGKAPDAYSESQLWLLYADKEYYSYNETVVITGHVPLDKLALNEHVTIEVFEPGGNSYVKEVMQETVADNGYYHYYFSLPPETIDLDNKQLLGEWKITAIYNSIEDHASFYLDPLDPKSQQERRTDLPSWEQLDECKGRGIKSGYCNDNELLKGICIGPVCNPESKPPILFDPVIVSLFIGTGVAVFAAALLVWKRKSKSVK